MNAEALRLIYYREILRSGPLDQRDGALTVREESGGVQEPVSHTAGF